MKQLSLVMFSMMIALSACKKHVIEPEKVRPELSWSEVDRVATMNFNEVGTTPDQTLLSVCNDSNTHQIPMQISGRAVGSSNYNDSQMFSYNTDPYSSAHLPCSKFGVTVKINGVALSPTSTQMKAVWNTTHGCKIFITRFDTNVNEFSVEPTITSNMNPMSKDILTVNCISQKVTRSVYKF